MNYENSSENLDVEREPAHLIESILAKLGLTADEVPSQCIDKIVTDDNFRKAVAVSENIREVRERLQRYENRLRRSSRISRLLLGAEVIVTGLLTYMYYLILKELKGYLDAVCKVSSTCPPAVVLQVISVGMLAALVMYVPISLAIHKTISVTKSFRTAIETQNEVLKDLNRELEKLTSKLAIALRDCVETWRDTL
ncbi:MAG: hypothetical protein DRO12_04460 [Thermoprotei archaeon]|nr:MAG: hypothetical protein DRO12_04460 [Thermoprotei archaeon]